MTAYRALLAARPADPYLRWEVVPDQVRQSWCDGDAAVWLAPSAYHGKAWLTGVGDPAIVARLAVSALDDAVVGVSLPSASLELLQPAVRPPRLDRWTWWWTPESPDRKDPAVQVLPDQDPRLPALLSQSASVYLWPGDARVKGWFGLVEGDRLLACLAHEQHRPGVPHLASVVVDESARGRGYGTRLCGHAVTALFQAGAPVVSLAMMTENAVAAQLYQRLGFLPGPSLASGTIPGRRHLPPMPGWSS